MGIKNGVVFGAAVVSGFQVRVGAGVKIEARKGVRSGVRVEIRVQI